MYIFQGYIKYSFYIYVQQTKSQCNVVVKIWELNWGHDNLTCHSVKEFTSWLWLSHSVSAHPIFTHFLIWNKMCREEIPIYAAMMTAEKIWNGNGNLRMSYNEYGISGTVKPNPAFLQKVLVDRLSSLVSKDEEFSNISRFSYGHTALMLPSCLYSGLWTDITKLFPSTRTWDRNTKIRRYIGEGSLHLTCICIVP